MFISINPTTGETIERYPIMDNREVDARVEKSVTTFLEWRRIPIEEKATIWREIAKALIDRKEELAKIITLEMGKPIKQALAEVEKSARNFDFYANVAPTLLKDKPVETEHLKSYVHFEPLGTILAIMPWNFPLWQVVRLAAPTLIAGNTMLLKHAENVTTISLQIEKLFIESGLPEGVFQTVRIDIPTIHSLIKDRRIKGVALTGSVRAGREVAKSAGEAIKPSLLELGGSDPYIILDDANIEKAATICVKSRFNNTGQTCIAAKRWIISKKSSDKFIDTVMEKISLLKVGDPLDTNTDLGPLAREDLRSNLHKQVIKSVQLGAKLLMGGEIPQGKGFFYPPTLLVVNNDSYYNLPLSCEEIFGPVASVIIVDNEKEALEVANSTDYGLGACVITSDIEKGEKIARYKLDAGNCFVNSVVKSDPRTPFGGIKNSGYGRELGEYGLIAFTNIKTVVVDKL